MVTTHPVKTRPRPRSIREAARRGPWTPGHVPRTNIGRQGLARIHGRREVVRSTWEVLAAITALVCLSGCWKGDGNIL